MLRPSHRMNGRYDENNHIIPRNAEKWGHCDHLYQWELKGRCNHSWQAYACHSRIALREVTLHQNVVQGSLQLSGV